MQNILETQVSDLSSLVDSPIIPIPLTSHSAHSSPFAMPNAPMHSHQGQGQAQGYQGQMHQMAQGQGQAQQTSGQVHSQAPQQAAAQAQGQAQNLDRRRDGESIERSVRGDTRERDSGGGNGKRKSVDAGQGSNGQPRAKRNRYISIACNECKRRKIKCNGQSPCQRCGNLNLSCQYAPNCCASSFKESEEFKAITSHLTSLQQQVESLYANMEALRRENERGLNGQSTTSVSQSPAEYRVKATPKFQGPTSSAYSFDVAKNTLQNMGYSGIETGLGAEGNGEEENETPMGSPGGPPTGGSGNMAQPGWIETRNMRGDGEPLHVLSREEALRLCQGYADEIGSMYPVLDMERVVDTCERVHRRLDEMERQQGGTRGVMDAARVQQQIAIPEDDINNLKMVIAIATVVEGSGLSSLGERLYQNIRPSFDAIIHRESVNIHDIPLIVLVATYHFHCDREALAWRAIGHASRMCIELGLHRSDSLFRHFQDEDDRRHAIRIFWSIYCLDRRWSFGTGMPFAMQDADIDPQLPGPEEELEYLKCMIEYSRLGGRVWRSVAGWEDGGEVRREDVGYLDYKVLEWQKSIPRALQLPSGGMGAASVGGLGVGGLTAQPTSRAMHRLQVILLLRTNQMRILIYRPVLHSSSSILNNLSFAETVVDLSRETIRTLTHLNETTDIYKAQQVCFNYFLISALAVLFLASCHAPSHFSERCKEEFYMALDLVKGFSSKSYVSKRLWRTIKGLKEVGPKLGLKLDGQTDAEEDPHSSAALAMAGLAGGGMLQMGHGGAGFGGTQGEEDGSPEVNGFHMSNEMTNLFEAALGAGTGLQGGFTPGNEGMGEGGAGMQGGMGALGMGNGSGMFGGEEELYRHMRDLF